MLLAVDDDGVEQNLIVSERVVFEHWDSGAVLALRQWELR